jgi:hypothetical protein
VWPARTPPPGGDPTPKPEPFVVNGVEIPIPSGADSIPPFTHTTADWAYATPGWESQVVFTSEGWITFILIMPEHLDDFRATLDALERAADPALINGRTFRVPWGAVYHVPFFAPWTGAYAGPPEEAPWLHYVKRGDSIISFESDGTVVAERIAEADAADFRAVADALSVSPD